MEPVARISPALAQRARDTHELWSIRRVEPSSASVSPRAGALGIAVGLVGVAILRRPSAASVSAVAIPRAPVVMCRR
jgi:hypothetical protein